MNKSGVFRFFAVFLLSLGMMGCSSVSKVMNKGKHKELDEKLVGKLQVDSVEVKLADSIKSKDLDNRVKKALTDELPNIDQGSNKAIMHVEVLNWEEPKSGMMSKMAGSVAKAHGRVKYKDPEGSLLADYEFWVENKEGGLLGGTVNFNDAKKVMMEKFVYFAYDGIQ